MDTELDVMKCSIVQIISKQGVQHVSTKKTKRLASGNRQRFQGQTANSESKIYLHPKDLIVHVFNFRSNVSSLNLMLCNCFSILTCKVTCFELLIMPEYMPNGSKRNVNIYAGKYVRTDARQKAARKIFNRVSDRMHIQHVLPDCTSETMSVTVAKSQ